MTTEEPMLEACGECGSPCHIETFNGPHIQGDVSLWVCSNHRRFGGDCPSDLAYFTADAWNDVSRTPPVDQDEVELSVCDAFDMGFEWAMGLQGQTLEDSRAVGRTLFSDTFAAIRDRFNTEDFDSFKSADHGISAAKKIIHAALASIGSGAGDVREAWQPIETAPEGDEEDGPLFDVTWAGEKHFYLPTARRQIDCFKENGLVKMKHGYPSLITVFRPQPTHWRPAPPAATDTGSGG